jgi:hypothetical protein
VDKIGFQSPNNENTPRNYHQTPREYAAAHPRADAAGSECLIALTHGIEIS